MFTGIIEEVGMVKAAAVGWLTIAAGETLQGTKVGDSLAVNGVCLTVTSLDASSFSLDVTPETLQRTNLGGLRPGSGVNLERALVLGGRVGGHLVQGHVDATGKIVSLVPRGESIIARCFAPRQVMRYVVEKGFITLDGVSLTVVDCDATSFSVSLIPHTIEHTNLGSKRAGDVVNLEVDIIAKYVEKLKEGQRGITLDFLAEHGFSQSPRSLSRAREEV
ncbi:MAG: riboflavin synthase [Chloroflexi bacterium]|nr:riboflavin synthase [Chloroflexota bacterium]